MEEPRTYHDDLHSDMKQKVPWWEQDFGEMFEQLSENVKNGGDQLAEQCKHVIDHKVSPLPLMGITSDSFSRESFERNLDAAREVGEAISQAPAATIDGLAESIRHGPRSPSTQKSNNPFHDFWK